MWINPMFVIGVFMIGMALGGLLMKIRFTSAVENAVVEQLEKDLSSNSSHRNVSA